MHSDQRRGGKHVGETPYRCYFVSGLHTTAIPNAERHRSGRASVVAIAGRLQKARHRPKPLSCGESMRAEAGLPARKLLPALGSERSGRRGIGRSGGPRRSLVRALCFLFRWRQPGDGRWSPAGTRRKPKRSGADSGAAAVPSSRMSRAGHCACRAQLLFGKKRHLAHTWPSPPLKESGENGSASPLATPTRGPGGAILPGGGGGGGAVPPLGDAAHRQQRSPPSVPLRGEGALQTTAQVQVRCAAASPESSRDWVCSTTNNRQRSKFFSSLFLFFFPSVSWHHLGRGDCHGGYLCPSGGDDALYICTLCMRSTLGFPTSCAESRCVVEVVVSDHGTGEERCGWPGGKKGRVCGVMKRRDETRRRWMTRAGVREHDVAGVIWRRR